MFLYENISQATLFLFLANVIIKYPDYDVFFHKPVGFGEEGWTGRYEDFCDNYTAPDFSCGTMYFLGKKLPTIEVNGEACK
jgi:hypothetical protein